MILGSVVEVLDVMPRAGFSCVFLVLVSLRGHSNALSATTVSLSSSAIVIYSIRSHEQFALLKFTSPQCL